MTVRRYVSVTESGVGCMKTGLNVRVNMTILKTKKQTLTKAKAISRVSGVGQFVTSLKHRLLLVYIYTTDLWLSSISMGKKKKAEKMVT